VLPIPTVDWGRWSPWGRFRLMRQEYNEIVERLIVKAERDGGLDEREDILALMLQARYDDGTAMSHSDVADQLLTLLTAGHETTATTLAWAVERLRRHPDVLRELSDEVRAGGKALREATILEVQRTRPVIDIVGRKIRSDGFRLGRWTLPKGLTVLAGIALIHEDAALFPNPRSFDPHRFVGAKPDLYQWIPFGGGARRCIGAAFAHLEMNVVLRTMLREFRIEPTDGPDERWHNRGVAYAPAKGGRAVVTRRRAAERVTRIDEADEAAEVPA
jgi:cytochrome P450